MLGSNSCQDLGKILGSWQDSCQDLAKIFSRQDSCQDFFLTRSCQEVWQDLAKILPRSYQDLTKILQKVEIGTILARPHDVLPRS